MKLNQLANKKILILGFGKEGRASLKFIKKRVISAVIKVADKNLSADYLKKQGGFDLVIKTPGIKKELVTAPYTTATNIFFANVKNKIIGITGSKGKSTTASLIYHILKTAGRPVHLVGNIGKPMLDKLLKPIGKDDVFVCELSSYQLDDIKYSPYITVITNLFPEHMNYHGGIKDYYRAKKNIINYVRPNDYFIYNPKNKILSDCAKQINCQVLPFEERITVSQQDIPLLGEHNRDNIKAAITVVHLFKISNHVIAQAIKTFKPLPHRLEYVGKYSGIIFYNDALATTPEATIEAIKALKNVGTIFLGGEDRGYRFINLVKIIKQYRIKNIVLFPKTGQKIYRQLKLQFNKLPRIFKTTDMEEAVKFAYQCTLKNSVCLLSTASPSYSLWKNYEEKGNLFKSFVKKYSI